jgi:hypothetical protein
MTPEALPGTAVNVPSEMPAALMPPVDRRFENPLLSRLENNP